LFTSAASRGRARWIGLAAFAALLAGLAVGYVQWRRATAPPPLPPIDIDAIHGGVPGASQMAELDSAAIKARWVEDVRGLDLAGLPAARRAIFVRYANAERCTCGCGYTLAGCRASDMSCEVSGPRLEALLDSVRTGRITSASGLRQRPHDGG
jgi:hypothetical protein